MLWCACAVPCNLCWVWLDALRGATGACQQPGANLPVGATSCRQADVRLQPTHSFPPPILAWCPSQALQPEPAEGQKEQERVPRGGFTDVGLHTGGLPRDTCWRLVWAAFKVRKHW